MTWVNGFVDLVMSVLLFIQAALYLPQLYRLWRLREAQAVSLWFLVGGVVVGVVGVLYSHNHHQHMALLGYGLISIVSTLTAFLALIFRIKGRLARRKGATL